ncbi:Bug family tripartite tricarboxylate transporter substrate binding protein [Humidisolicoccus flavus]|uniref:Bug family tripartite tricarboxylate transporter substrate binding protein n=1 Tax=Humidisolicoccus flavus TaxID=3111414 RepID=UPI003248EAA6
MRSMQRRSTRTRALATATLAGLTALTLVACSTGETGGGSNNSGDGSLSAVNIIAPADPGGGWDQTARAVAQIALSSDLVSTAPVTNIGGAGGTVGLASLATEQNPHTLMVTGLVMVGAVETNQSGTRIEDTTPIAKLTEESLVVVVPEASPYETIDDLVDAIVEEGPAIAVTGGSAGGADHILAGMLLTSAGVDPSEVTSTLNYIANSGGGEAVTMLLGNNVQAGISGAGEFIEQINAGSLRALAVSGPERLESLPDAPTLIESGYDVELTNWRGVLAPGNISEEDRQLLIDFVTELHGTEAWQEALTTNGWDDAFMPGDEFDTFLTANITEVQETLRTIGLTE